MDFLQFLAVRQSCRLDSALSTLIQTLPKAVKSGNSTIQARIPLPVAEGDPEPDESAKNLADIVIKVLFASDLRSQWRSDPISLEITQVAVVFWSGQEDQAATASYAARLSEYIVGSLAATVEAPPVTWSGTVQKSRLRPQLFIAVSTRLTDEAIETAKREHSRGDLPCPGSPN